MQFTIAAFTSELDFFPILDPPLADFHHPSQVADVSLHAKLLQSYLTLWDPMDSSPPGSSVHRILQARILKWVAISFSLDVSRIFYYSELQTLPPSLFRFTQILILSKHQFSSQCFISDLSITSPLANCSTLTSCFFTGCLQFWDCKVPLELPFLIILTIRPDKNHCL